MIKQDDISSLWDYSQPGRRCIDVPLSDVPSSPLPDGFERQELAELPELSELDLIRHYTRLSNLNFSIDGQFYPLGSCTMKYNPRVNEKTARFSGFTNSHPYLGEEYCQGNIALMHELQEILKGISGLPYVSLQPAAGAQGELAGVLMIKKYHSLRGDEARSEFLIPDSAHGTNPATVAMAGFQAREIPSDSRGNIDLEAVKSLCSDKTAGIMITNPNTLGLFEENLVEVIQIVHDAGGLVYGDGANMNAIMGVVKPGDLGFDVMHFNLHKTFSTPHGGGGPGAGPVAVNDKLKDCLPGKVAVQVDSGRYKLLGKADSIGSLKSFYGNFGVLVRAYTYGITMGRDGLKDASMMAVLSANYLKYLVKDVLPPWYDRVSMHEFVTSGEGIAPGIHTMDIAKRLIDYGFHPPTVYFPLIVPEALMIEPTETESIETIEAFAEALIKIVNEAINQPDLLHEAPHDKGVSRLDEVQAVKKPILRQLKIERI